jgi:hypothetical protein
MSQLERSAIAGRPGRMRVLALLAPAAVLAATAFTAGSTWRARRQVQIEEARGRFFEEAQGQFHWPERSKEWTEMLVPLGSVDFTTFGDQWRFGAMYEGTQPSCELEVVFKDTAGMVRAAGRHTLARAVPDSVAIDLRALGRQVDLRSVAELSLRMRGDGKAGRLLVAGMVNPRPALVRNVTSR